MDSSTPRPAADDSDDEKSAYESMDEAECKELLRPCKKQLRRLKEYETLPKEERVAALKECLSGIGAQIDKVVKEDKKNLPTDQKEKWLKHLWTFATYFWPNKKKVKASKLRAMHVKISASNSSPMPATTQLPPSSAAGSSSNDAAPSKRKPSQGLDAPIPKRPRPEADSAASSSSHSRHVDEKEHRKNESYSIPRSNSQHANDGRDWKNDDRSRWDDRIPNHSSSNGHSHQDSGSNSNYQRPPPPPPPSNPPPPPPPSSSIPLPPGPPPPPPPSH